MSERKIKPVDMTKLGPDFEVAMELLGLKDTWGGDSKCIRKCIRFFVGNREKVWDKWNREFSPEEQAFIIKKCKEVRK